MDGVYFEAGSWSARALEVYGGQSRGRISTAPGVNELCMSIAYNAEFNNEMESAGRTGWKERDSETARIPLSCYYKTPLATKLFSFSRLLHTFLVSCTLLFPSVVRSVVCADLLEYYSISLSITCRVARAEFPSMVPEFQLSDFFVLRQKLSE